MTLTILNSILRAEDLFDSLDKEKKEQEDLRIKVEKSERLEQIVRGFENALKVNENSIEKYYNEILRLVQITPTSKEILGFSILMSDYQDNMNFKRNSGLYLSSLINKSDEKEFTINTRHLEKLPNFLGNYNDGKIIKINGDAGDFMGHFMQGGKFYAENANYFLGSEMRGGTIYIKNAGNFVGDSMQAGKIYAENAEDNVGFEMQCGTIHIGNSYKSLSDSIKGGNIYFQGKLIVKDGVKLI
jgi:hypothetical protein